MKFGKVGISAVSAVAVLVAGAGAAWAVQDDDGSEKKAEKADSAIVALRDLDGDRAGTVRLDSRGDHTQVRAYVHGIEPGFHGFHIHTVGTCDPDTDFTSAEGHYNPTDADHGDHAGDMPSLLATEEDAARLAFRTDRFTVSDLRDSDGSAVMVHEQRDNFAHIPDRYRSTEEDTSGPDSDTLATGDAGARIACGELR